MTSSPQFRFAAKLWGRFTHDRNTLWTRVDEERMKAPLDVLHQSGRLGALMLQFPWSFKRNNTNRHWLAHVVRAFRRYPLVVEVRHASWHHPKFYESLRAQGIGFVNIDQPVIGDLVPPFGCIDK